MSAGPVRGRSGYTVMETLVALALGWLVAWLALTTLARQRTAMAGMVHRSDALALTRMARVVLGAEARAGVAARDGWTVDAESIDLRAYRGLALPCIAPNGSDRVLVHVRGDRLPDPTKDSVLLVDFSGGGPVHALLERASADPSECPGAGPGTTERWVLSGVASPGTTVLRYFERGSYHLSGRALRYRRGLGGRQPLSPEVLADGPSGFVGEAGAVEVRIVTEDPVGVRRSWPRVLLPRGPGPDGG